MVQSHLSPLTINYLNLFINYFWLYIKKITWFYNRSYSWGLPITSENISSFQNLEPVTFCRNLMKLIVFWPVISRCWGPSLASSVLPLNEVVE